MFATDNCKDCVSRCMHAGKDRKFVCPGGVSCKITKKRGMTNAQKIRAMSDDELSKQLVIVIDVDGLQPCRMYLSAPTGKIYLSRAEAVKATKEWLQQPAEEDT